MDSAEDKEIAAIVERPEKQFPDIPAPEVAAVICEAHGVLVVGRSELRAGPRRTRRTSSLRGRSTERLRAVRPAL